MNNEGNENQIESQEFEYCIGKASRYKEYDVVDSVPYISNTIDTESQLRCGIYKSYKLAKEAARLARKYNPVGFVVLILNGER